MNIPKKYYSVVSAVAAISIIVITLLILALRGYIYIPSQFNIGPVTVRYYSLMILTGILIAAFLLDRESKKHPGFKKAKIDEALLWVVFPGIIFARLWYVIIFWQVYAPDPLRAFYIWEGGLSIFGAFVGGVIGLSLYAKRYKLPLLKMIELSVIFVPIGQIFGRFGNFFNQELYGPETGMPWGMFIRATGKYHHPAFLYEQWGNLLLFLILYHIYKRRGLEGNGRLVAAYLGGYGLLRFVVDIFRNDIRVFQGLTIAQLISIILVIAASGYFLLLKYKISRSHERS